MGAVDVRGSGCTVPVGRGKPLFSVQSFFVLDVFFVELEEEARF